MSCRWNDAIRALSLTAWLLFSAPASANGFAERLTRVEALVNTDARAAVAQAREVLAGAQAAADAAATAEAQRVLGLGLNILGDNQAALAAYADARAGFAAQGARSREALVLRHEGVSHFDVGDYDLALESYLAALAIFEALAEPVEIAKTRANIANVYQTTDRLPQAIEYHREALREFERARVPIGVAGSALNLGAALVALAETGSADGAAASAMLDEATVNYRKSLEIFRALDIPRGILKAESNLAAVQQRLGDLDAAVAGFTRTRAGAAAIGDHLEEAVALRKLMDLEASRDRYAESLVHAQAGIAISQRSGDIATEERFQRGASQMHEQLGDSASALRHARRVDELVQQRLGRDVDSRIAELTRKFEDEQRDQELLTLRQSKALDQAQLARQRVQRNAALVIGVLALGVLALMWSRQRLRERTRHELEQAVMTDPLTGLLNRRGLRALVGSSAIASEGYAVVLCDIDNFKQINDQHGHDIGDAVLVETARRLRAGLRPEDSAARWGGEEFLVVLGICTIAEGMLVAERLRQAVAEPPQAGVPGGLAVTISLGLAASTHGQGFDVTVRAADQALLQAKREGKNRVVVAASKVRSLSPLGAPTPPPRAAQSG